MPTPIYPFTVTPPNQDPVTGTQIDVTSNHSQTDRTMVSTFTLYDGNLNTLASWQQSTLDEQETLDWKNSGSPDPTLLVLASIGAVPVGASVPTPPADPDNAEV